MTTQTVGGRSYEFGLTDRLRIARELSGFGQREFAEATGIGRNSIVNYESGTTKPRRPQLIAWAMATGFSLEWLQTGEDPQDGSPDGGLSEESVRREGIEPPTRWYEACPSQDVLTEAA